MKSNWKRQRIASKKAMVKYHRKLKFLKSVFPKIFAGLTRLAENIIQALSSVVETTLKLNNGFSELNKLIGEE